MKFLLCNATPRYAKTFRHVVTAATLLSVTCLVGCGPKDSAAVAQKIEPPKVKVSTVVKRDDVITSQFFTGTVRESERVDIRARVQGYLEKVHFEDGANVKAGQPLFDIERQQYEARLAGASALLLGTQNKLDEADDRVRRGKAAGNAISAEEMATRETQRDVAAAAVAEAEASVADAKINLSYTKIASPISGRIGRRLVDAGNLVGTDGKTLLTTVVKRQPIQIYFEVSGPVVDRVQRLKNEERKENKGKGPRPKVNHGKLVVPVEAELTNETGFPHKGQLDYIDFEVDSTTGTAMVRGLFQNEGDLLFPGAFVRVRIPSPDPQTAVMVEDNAIGTNTQGRFVFIVVDDEIDGQMVKNVVQTRQVKRGELIDGMRVITEGLDGGETYIVEGVQQARSGLPVTVLQESGANAGGPAKAVEPPPAKKSPPKS